MVFEVFTFVGFCRRYDGAGFPPLLSAGKISGSSNFKVNLVICLPSIRELLLISRKWNWTTPIYVVLTVSLH